MDHQTFDRLTRLFAESGSRRTALRALIAGAFLGAATRSSAAKPCTNDTNARCTCGETSNCVPASALGRI